MKAVLLAMGLLMLAQPVAASSNPLRIAEGYIGYSEVKHRAKLRRLMGVDPRRPWCGAFAGAIIRKAGRKPPKAHNIAISWLRFGKPVRISQARPGDVVVVRSVRNHVGFFHSVRKGKVCLISGNSNNRVRLSCYAMGRVKGVRR